MRLMLILVLLLRIKSTMAILSKVFLYNKLVTTVVPATSKAHHMIDNVMEVMVVCQI